ncbi:uncharacterized protein EV420DRAFT_1252858, partial [Desarmillaria tabescens]
NRRGWIYMEAPYNEVVKKFLLMTPGVRKMGYAPPWYIRVESIDIAEWGTILREDDEQHLQAGSWVRIKRGLYRDDIGVIYETTPGNVIVLLIPRL